MFYLTVLKDQEARQETKDKIKLINFNVRGNNKYTYIQGFYALTALRVHHYIIVMGISIYLMDSLSQNIVNVHLNKYMYIVGLNH